MAAFLYRPCVRARMTELHKYFTIVTVRPLPVFCESSFTSKCINSLKAPCGSLSFHSIKYCTQRSKNVSIRKLHLSNPLKEQMPLETNTNVVKDVIMFKHDNSKFFKILNAFALAQFFFWTYLSHFCFTKMRDAPVIKEKKEGDPWWRNLNLGENKFKNTLAALCFIIGYGILAGSWMFSLKSVRYLILRKGGKEVTFVTYGPFGKNRMMTVGLGNVSCEESRKNARVQLPIKVKGHLLYYMLDMRGQFTNARLFDVTAGLKRVWKN